MKLKQRKWAQEKPTGESEHFVVVNSFLSLIDFSGRLYKNSLEGSAVIFHRRVKTLSDEFWGTAASVLPVKVQTGRRHGSVRRDGVAVRSSGGCSLLAACWPRCYCNLHLTI